ncbi:MAG: hypothetical protein H6998_18985 [Hahellaceae bacterium]|nr:hypothetical protein [Hahellaceae bacterium]
MTAEVVSILLEWSYKPENFLEEPILLDHKGINIEISDGVAQAIVDPELFHREDALRSDLTLLIESHLQSVQLTTHKGYEISKPSRTDLKSDGKKVVFAEVELNVACTMGSPDITITDKNGVVISDTKQERLDRQARCASLISEYKKIDLTLQHMLSSYSKAVVDPENELVHLYEVRDALSARFGKSDKAIKALDVRKLWNELGRIANELPLMQGRHRGKSAGQLRNAEQSELDRARDLAYALIEKYLDFLESENKAL